MEVVVVNKLQSLEDILNCISELVKNTGLEGNLNIGVSNKLMCSLNDQGITQYGSGYNTFSIWYMGGKGFIQGIDSIPNGQIIIRNETHKWVISEKSAIFDSDMKSFLS